MLYKTLFVLSIIAVFASALFVGSGPVMPFVPTTPQFINPYSVNGWVSNLVLTSPLVYENISTHNTVQNNGCSNVTYWNCVNEVVPDENASYFTLDLNRTMNGGIYNGSPTVIAQIGLNQEQWNSFVNFTADIWCKGSSGIDFGVGYYDTGPTVVHLIYSMSYHICTNSSTFQHITITRLPGGSWNAPPYSTSTMIIYMSALNASFSTMKVTGFFQATSGCNSSDWFANAVCGAFNAPIIGDIIRFLTLVFDALSYFVGWIVFLVQTFANYLSVILWLYNIPGMPSFIQLYVDAVLTAWLAIVSIEIWTVINPFKGR